MSAVADIAEALYAALAGVQGVRVYRDPAAPIDPPASVLAAPSLSWDGPCHEPSTASFRVYVIVAMDDRALDRLWDLVPQVAEAVDTVPEAVVTRATPGVYTSGGVDLPSYDLTVETVT